MAFLSGSNPVGSGTFPFPGSPPLPAFLPIYLALGSLSLLAPFCPDLRIWPQPPSEVCHPAHPQWPQGTDVAWAPSAAPVVGEPMPLRPRGAETGSEGAGQTRVDWSPARANQREDQPSCAGGRWGQGWPGSHSDPGAWGPGRPFPTPLPPPLPSRAGRTEPNARPSLPLPEDARIQTGILRMRNSKQPT